MVTTVHRWRFTPTEYARMAETGIFDAGDAVALLDGELVVQPAGDTARPYRFTAAQYKRLGEFGILDEDRHMELIAGEIVAMSAIGRRHARCVDQLTLLLARTIPDGLFVHVQNPVQLDRGNVPEPDLAVIVDHGPDSPAVSAADALLVIEVSDSTLAYDTGDKLSRYAAAHIPEYWVVNLPDGTLTRYTEPVGRTYKQTTVARSGDALPSLTVPALRIPVADILH